MIIQTTATAKGAAGPDAPQAYSGYGSVVLAYCARTTTGETLSEAK